MKKVSTAAVKATKNFSQPKLTIGLDLGDLSKLSKTRESLAHWSKN